MARVVAPAPFDAPPDGPTCAAELSAHQPRSGSLPRDQFRSTITGYCEVRLAAKANDDRTRTRPCSAACDRGAGSAGGSQVLGCPSLMTPERNHSETTCHMRWCAHAITQSACGGGAMWTSAERWQRSTTWMGFYYIARGQIAVEQSAHTRCHRPKLCVRGLLS